MNLEDEINKIKSYIKEEDKKYSLPGDWYGMGNALKKFLGVPNFIRLYVEMDHGVPQGDTPSNRQLKSKLPILVTRPEQQNELQKLKIASFVMGSPFVHYRRMEGIKQLENAIGTVVFPSHSSHLVDSVFDWDDYAESLLSLPTYLHPLTVCIYWIDLIKGRHKAFENRGLNVVTAGHMNDPQFMHNFYQILQKHRYSTSNHILSATFYSIDLGIPFFIYGNEPILNNFGSDPNVPNGHYSVKQDINKNVFNLYKEFEFENLYKININSVVSKEVDHLLGKNTQIDKRRLKKIVLIYSLIGVFVITYARIKLLIKYKFKKWFNYQHSK